MLPDIIASFAKEKKKKKHQLSENDDRNRSYQSHLTWRQQTGIWKKLLINSGLCRTEKGNHRRL